jgi:hypothetical protein
MGEMLTRYTSTVRGSDGAEYTASACGRARDDGTWEGWLEFEPADGGAAVRTARETTQPNRVDTAYWASGLTTAYLEGALARATRRPASEAAPSAVPSRFEGPAAGVGTATRGIAPDHRSVLDPFAVHRHSGEDVLRRELRALSVAHLREIVGEYRIHPGGEEAVLRAALAELIVTAARGGPRDGG